MTVIICGNFQGVEASVGIKQKIHGLLATKCEGCIVETSEASPTLGCSIEISCDIHIGQYVGMSTKNMYAKMRGRNYVF